MGTMDKSEIDSFLHDAYFNLKNETAFKGINNLFKKARNEFPNIPKSYVRNWLQKQNTYSVHHKKVSNFKRSYFISKHKDDNWQADLVEITNYYHNGNNKYIVMIVDVHSKFGWAIAVKNKKALTIKNVFEGVFKSSNRKPKILTTDAGLEFNNSLFRGFLQQNGVHFSIARGITKAANVERWNRTIKDLISKYSYKNKTKRFIDVLPNIVDGYNNTVHSRTKFKPNEINDENEFRAYQNLYKKRDTYISPQLRVGDQVRLQRIKSHFEKGYTPSWTEDLFVIHKVLKTSPVPRYIVRDQSGEELLGSLYSQELLKVNDGYRDI